MQTNSSQSSTLGRQGRSLFIIVVVVGFVLSFVIASGPEGFPFSFQEVALSLILGVIYLFLGLNDNMIFSLFTRGGGKILYFVVQCSLVFF